MRKEIDLIAIFLFGAMVVYIASVVSSNGAAAQYAVSGFWGGWVESPKISTIAFWIVLVYLGLVVLTCSLCWKKSPIGVGGFRHSFDYGSRQSLLFNLCLLRNVRSGTFHWRPAYAHYVILRIGYFWRSICL